MSFKKFLTEIKSVRDYEENHIGNLLMEEVKVFLDGINNAENVKGAFCFKIVEDGNSVFEGLEGVGGYSGIMIKSPHYISLVLSNDTIETEFIGAYYMQSIVKKLYELDLGSCWINVSKASDVIKSHILNEKDKYINYLLAFGKAKGKSDKQKSAIHIQSGKDYKTNPYGARVVEKLDSETSRLGISDIVYLHDWENEISYEELQNRGLADLFYYVRNAPSYKNRQPVRFILRDGEVCLVVKNPNNKENITDGGIMAFTILGMAKYLGIPAKWSYVGDNALDLTSLEYIKLAKIEL